MGDFGPTEDNQFKVRLEDSTVAADQLTVRRPSVTFDVTPDLIENRNTNYKPLDPLHAPGQLQVFQNTASRTFNLSNIRLISRTRQEASQNLQRLWTLRGWTVPFFGQGYDVNKDLAALQRRITNREDVGAARAFGFFARGDEFLGSPPKVVLLSAYSRQGATVGTRGIGHIRRVPCVIQQLSIPYPSDVDYIPTADDQPTPMPTIMTLDMTLVETHSPSEYEQFSLQDFREGILTGF